MARSGPQGRRAACTHYPAKLRRAQPPVMKARLQGIYQQMTAKAPPEMADKGKPTQDMPEEHLAVTRTNGPDGDIQANAPAVTPDRSTTDAALRSILRDVLALDLEQVERFGHDTGLFGHLPELDSMAVASLFTEMEDRLDIIIEDDDVDGEMLETYGGLLTFTEAKSVET